MVSWSTNLSSRVGKQCKKIDNDVREKRKDSGSLKSITADGI